VAAALCAAAGCHSEKRATPPATAAPAPARPVPPSPPEPGQVAREQLDAARARRLRIAQAEQQPEPEAAAIATDAQTCASEARRSWTALFPEAAGRVRAVERIGAAGAEALYLDAVCTAIVARMQGFTPLIELRGELTSALERVASLAPDLDGAGAEREMGALLAALPTDRDAGGDLDQARKHLLSAVEHAPRDARNRMVLASTVAVKAQDRALFREQLGQVVKGGDSQAAAQAQALLEREDELFGPAEAAQPVPGGPQR
jgi:hypothetical protein